MALGTAGRSVVGIDGVGDFCSRTNKQQDSRYTPNCCKLTENARGLHPGPHHDVKPTLGIRRHICKASAIHTSICKSPTSQSEQTVGE